MATLDSAAAELRINLGKSIRDAAVQGLTQVGRATQDLVNEFNDVSIKTNLARQQINDRLAKEMQSAVKTAYAQNVLARQSVPSYRAGQGRFPQALGSAIDSADFAVGTGVGIAFINTDLLDNAARHWARLNYGAGGNPDGLEAPSATIAFGDVSFSLRLGGGARPAFNIPAAPGRFGYFNKVGQFYPGLPKDKSDVPLRSRPTKGIGARRFLDAGLQALAVGFSPAYNDYLNTAARTAASKSTGRSFRTQ